MSQKVEKPVLSGQRIKTRKRDEKERYDPIGFRDAIISGLDKCSNDFEAISRYLDSAGNKLDYRRYGECLFDILIAGGILDFMLQLLASFSVLAVHQKFLQEEKSRQSIFPYFLSRPQYQFWISLEMEDLSRIIFRRNAQRIITNAASATL